MEGTSEFSLRHTVFFIDQSFHLFLGFLIEIFTGPSLLSWCFAPFPDSYIKNCSTCFLAQKMVNSENYPQMSYTRFQRASLLFKLIFESMIKLIIVVYLVFNRDYER